MPCVACTVTLSGSKLMALHWRHACAAAASSAAEPERAPPTSTLPTLVMPTRSPAAPAMAVPLHSCCTAV